MRTTKKQAEDLEHCPHCKHRLSPAFLKRAGAKALQAARKRNVGGFSGTEVETPCRYNCGAVLRTARLEREHISECPNAPSRKWKSRKVAAAKK